ncbi:mitochondrial branched-chain alpha-ketoacid dehydrogenase kinase domain-containing protein [Trichoderma breve]|uniref:Protein-serine/threonine kinase n=1 Tax=Trichoderma breve TaxID=2034170 RepID=A0A9W9EDA4_9HYPO|nr:mitochondrial branched-chain alpha-ketoacid dehydrogenase kinase domain-containing protein [Trichoderma breve]KAJ4864544.1 mitochondrial branched-chain alpha-ketoacid dehydrogenase kinase domain-containing protein [Trichoderma breve]
MRAMFRHTRLLQPLGIRAPTPLRPQLRCFTSNIAHDVSGAEISALANLPQHPLSLADLVRQGRPPLSERSLLASANFTLSLIPIRLAHRLQALQNLPYIVVSNPNISQIYNNYLHSLSILLPYWQAASKGRAITTLDNEIKFTNALAELVATHTDTIPVLAKGFLECRKYISPEEVTRFLDEHLRARIGTRLISEQHIALHFSSQPHFDPGASPTPCPEHPTYIGVIDTALKPALIVESCAGFVADICELRYGIRPKLIINGEPETTFAFLPMHLEYIITELLKNAFRASIESKSNEPIEVTIAPEPPLKLQPGGAPEIKTPSEDLGVFKSDAIKPLDDNAPGVTIRIRDRGGGIPPDVLPNIWSYSFTTFSEDDDVPGSTGNDGLGAIATASTGGSSIAGLGYGLPLSRAYAEYFGGGIAVQSLYGWGTDVYLRLKGVGKVDKK